jgi:hypothetical protein
MKQSKRKAVQTTRKKPRRDKEEELNHENILASSIPLSQDQDYAVVSTLQNNLNQANISGNDSGNYIINSYNNISIWKVDIQ